MTEIEEEIKLQSYTIRLFKDGTRDILSYGHPWMQMQKNTLIWELVDKLIEFKTALEGIE